MNEEVKMLALTGIASKKLVEEAKKALPCGFRGTFKLRAEVEGIVTKGDASDKAATCKPDPIAFAIELVARLKLTKAAAASLIEGATVSAILHTEACKARPQAGWVEQAILSGQEAARPELPRVPVEGAVKVVHSRIEVEEIS